MEQNPLTKAQMLAAKGRQYEVFDVPELGGPVRIRTPSGASCTAVRELQRRAEKGEDVDQELTCVILASGLVDGDGKPLFDMEGAKELVRELSDETIQFIVGRIGEFRKRMTADSQKETPRGNSEAVPSDG